MSNYTVLQGDTYASIARKVYGDEQQARLIRQANPGVAEPLSPGTSVVTPPLPGTPQNKPQSGLSATVNEVALLINEERFRFWDSVRILRNLDTLDSIEFTAPFNPDDPAQRQAFRPFAYPSVEFTVEGSTLFRGTLLGPIPELSPDSIMLTLGGYSLPGVLSDCNLPASAHPLEFNDATLEDIAVQVAGYFGLAVRFDAPAGALFDRVACEPERKGLAFLAELAKQRNLIIGNDRDGTLVFRQSAGVTTPVARLAQGESPVVEVKPFFDHQQYYSHVTGIEPVVVGATGSQYTVKNARLAGVLRPLTFKVADAVGGDVQPATEAKMGRMFGNMASYSVTVNTWRDANGNLWEPNTTVQVLAPGAMVYTPYNFIVRSVALGREADNEEATLDLVLPGAFSGQTPEALPWDE